jgi:hypothetical protein
MTYDTFRAHCRQLGLGDRRDRQRRTQGRADPRQGADTPGRRSALPSPSAPASESGGSDRSPRTFEHSRIPQRDEIY